MNTYIEANKQLADVIDASDSKEEARQKFYKNFKMWEAEDQTRTMVEHDRAVGRARGYTAEIVTSVTAYDGVVARPKAPSAGQIKDASEDTLLKAARDPEVRAKMNRALDREHQERQEISDDRQREREPELITTSANANLASTLRNTRHHIIKFLEKDTPNENTLEAKNDLQSALEMLDAAASLHEDLR